MELKNLWKIIKVSLKYKRCLIIKYNLKTNLFNAKITTKEYKGLTSEKSIKEKMQVYLNLKII